MTQKKSGWADRAAGVLLATAAGDALGAGYEFTHPTPGTPINMIGGGPFGFQPGEWTDDTSMAVAVARVTATGLDLRTPAGLDAVAAGFAEWYASHPKDIGNQTRAVLSARDKSGAAMQATARGVSGRKGGNGSLMRTASVGIAYLDDAEACVEAAEQVSALTHDDERAHQACQLWSYAIRHAVLYATFDGVRKYLDVAGGEMADYWGPLLDVAETGRPQDFPNNGWVVHALQTAWWAITHADQSDATHLQKALELAVRAGHDTDTTAAIAGVLLGARWGASAVPAAWRRILHGWPGLRSKDLISLASRTARNGRDDGLGWPSIKRVNYSEWKTGYAAVPHPHDSGVLVGGYDSAFKGSTDAVVSLCRMGSADLNAEHIEFWLIDDGPQQNPNLEFVLDDAARTIQALRAEGKTVLLHCVEGRSRTPSVAARYSMLLDRDPDEVLSTMTRAKPNSELWKAATTPPASNSTNPKQSRQEGDGELAQACRDWQGGRDVGSTPLRGAARVITGVPHYFTADFITEQETRAQANPAARRSAEVLLAAVNRAPLRTADQWNASVGLNPRGFAGRGLEPKAPYDDQILAALHTGRLAMPLWGVSLSRFAALWFGTVGKHPKPRFMFEIVGAFPAVPAWTLSGERADEEELICGGEYLVEDVRDDVDNYGRTTMTLSYLQPIPFTSS